MKLFIRAIGWFGMGAILLAYALLSYEVLDQAGAPYHFINLTGATTLIIYSIYHRTYPVLALNIIWGFIALSSIFRILVIT